MEGGGLSGNEVRLMEYITSALILFTNARWCGRVYHAGLRPFPVIQDP